MRNAIIFPLILALTTHCQVDADQPPKAHHEPLTSFQEYKFTGAHPLPLRQAREDWASLKQRWQTDPAVKSWVDGRQRRLDGWITQYGDKPEWIAGWAHNLIDLSTGLPSVWTWTMPEPPNVTPPEQKVHGAWVMNVRETNIHSLAEAVYLWKLTGNSRDLAWAASQIDMYATAYAKWPIQKLNGTSQMMGQSLDEATNGIFLADAVRVMGNAIPPAQRQRWNRGLFAPMLANIAASNRGDNNIAVWQACAAAVLAATISDNTAYQRAIDGPNGVRAMIDRGITGDYLWFEPSVAYGRYTQLALARLFAFLSLTGRAGPLRDEMLLTQNMLISEAAMRFADGTLPAIGDSDSGIKAFDPSLLSITQRTMPIRIPALPKITWDTLLDPAQPTALTPQETTSRYWPSSQTAMIRHSGWELFANWGQLSASHAQGDALSYDLRFNGTVISAAPGTANYGSQLFLTYLRTSAAHNQPIIDGQGEIAFQPGQLLQSDNQHLVISNPGFAQSAQVTRTFALDAHGATIETETFVPSGLHRLGDIFNTVCEVTPVIAASPATLASLARGPGFAWLKNIRANSASRNWRAILTCRSQRFMITLTASAPGSLTLADAPDNQGKLTRTAIFFEAENQSELHVIWHFNPL